MASETLRQAAEDGVALLNDLAVPVSNEERERVSPWLAHRAKAIVMLWGTKAGLILGGRRGRGFLLVQLPTQDGQPPRWSAPVFVNVKVGFFGLCLGYSHTRSIMLAMSDQLLKELEGGGHSIVGADHTFAMGQDSETKANVITTPAGSADLVVSALVSGAMMDFSLAAGSMTVDKDQLKALYGETPLKSVFSGAVMPPPEMEPLYTRLTSFVYDAKVASPSLMRTSIERMTAGFDPDRRIVTSTSARLLHKGDSAERITADEP